MSEADSATETRQILEGLSALKGKHNCYGAGRTNCGQGHHDVYFIPEPEVIKDLRGFVVKVRWRCGCCGAKLE